MSEDYQLEEEEFDQYSVDYDQRELSGGLSFEPGKEAPGEIIEVVNNSLGFLARAFGVPESDYINEIPDIRLVEGERASYKPDLNVLVMRPATQKSGLIETASEELTHFLRSMYDDLESSYGEIDADLLEYMTAQEFFGALGRIVAGYEVEDTVGEDTDSIITEFSEAKERLEPEESQDTRREVLLTRDTGISAEDIATVDAVSHRIGYKLGRICGTEILEKFPLLIQRPRKEVLEIVFDYADL